MKSLITTSTATLRKRLVSWRQEIGTESWLAEAAQSVVNDLTAEIERRGEPVLAETD